MNIWQFQNLLTRRLLTINAANILAGLLVLPAAAFWRGFGTQAVGWGLVNVGIAVFGGRAARRRSLAPDALEQAVMAREARSLCRLLWINAGLDVLYMLGGWQLTRRAAPGDALRRGHGWGIVAQGGLLFVFDVAHALLLRRVS